MESKKHSQQFLKKRKFLLVLPLIVLPFITMIFWSLGGGKRNDVEAQIVSKRSGLNLKIPDAKLKSDKGFDKLSFYKQAALDSQKIFKERKLDPYWDKYSLSNKTEEDPFRLKLKYSERNQFSNGDLQTSLSARRNIDENEAKIYSKLEQLNAQLNKAKSKAPISKFNGSNMQPVGETASSKDIDKLEQMMRAMKEDAGGDPQMNQLNNILDKILAVQRPESVNDTTYKSTQANSKSYLVGISNSEPNISLIISQAKHNYNDTIPVVSLNDSHNSFYSFNEESASISLCENVIKAVVPETQILVTGSTVKLLLANNITVKGNTIPKNTYIYGTASLNNERLKINISSIQYQNNILPVSLDIYDLDGLTGIYVPGSISRDVAKQSTDQAVNSIGVATLDPSLAAQATSAGIQAAKTLISKKVKLVKVTVKAGYQVLLKNNNQKQ